MKNDESHDEIEVKINRLLDGELAGAERAELERELLCNPDAHAMLRDYTALDEQVREAMDAALAPSPSQAPPARRALWPAVAAAVAAAAVLAVVLWSTFQHRPGPPDRNIVKTPDNPAPTTAAVELITDQFVPTPPAETFVRPVRRVDRFPVGLFDAESGQFRVIQVDREQTRMQPVWLDL